MNSEKELFKQAYMNLRSGDRIPFPDAVFDEFLRLRQGYKLVPVEPTENMLSSARDWSVRKYGQGVGNSGAIGCYKAMIGAVDEI